jgi:5-methylcytosine-specific restriction endonuclease McrA
MDVGRIESAVAVIEEELRTLDAEITDRGWARRLLAVCSRGERICAGVVAMVARRIGDPQLVAREAGVSVGRARAIVGLSDRLHDTPALGDAIRDGSLSLDQATEIAKAESAAPGCAADLVEVAGRDPFHVLRSTARERVLAAARPDLGERQRRARRASHRITDLGLVHIEADLEPHVGAPIVEQLEAEASRRSSSAGAGSHRALLADAFAASFGSGSGARQRGELVVVVSEEVARRGWTTVEDGEVCRIPGVGPLDPKVAREIAEDAFITGVVSDGTDLRHLRRWTRSIPVEIRLALRLGAPPRFDGPRCVDCGNRFRLEKDHQIPFADGGLTSVANLPLRCQPCHHKKTTRDAARRRQRRRLDPVGVGTSRERDPP